MTVLFAFNDNAPAGRMRHDFFRHNYAGVATVFINHADTTHCNYIPYFFAVIVNDLDACEKWYRSVFALTVTKRMNEPAAGFKVIVLESPQLVIELIEDSASVTAAAILAGKPAGTKIKGLFKAGFHVANMNDCLERFSTLKINTGKIYKDSAGKRNFLVNDPDGNLIQFFE